MCWMLEHAAVQASPFTLLDQAANLIVNTRLHCPVSAPQLTSMKRTASGIWALHELHVAI